jgi:hypothetical protein
MWSIFYSLRAERLELASTPSATARPAHVGTATIGDYLGDDEGVVPEDCEEPAPYLARG